MAVLNGRLDLAQADAVLALIRARDDAEARAAHLALEGGDLRRLESFEDALVDLLVPLESALDFSDQDFLAVVPSDLAVRAAALAAAFEKAAEGTAPTRSDDLPRVVLVGRANAGKSTLWNALTGGVALTGDIPGTTSRSSRARGFLRRNARRLDRHRRHRRAARTGRRRRPRASRPSRARSGSSRRCRRRAPYSRNSAI
jgi:tRNA U34 5-carboxymethylaminomethyl modifying GTPase MnmE/TrmE